MVLPLYPPWFVVVFFILVELTLISLKNSPRTIKIVSKILAFLTPIIIIHIFSPETTWLYSFPEEDRPIFSPLSPLLCRTAFHSFLEKINLSFLPTALLLLIILVPLLSE